jgi:hypothetical protein
MKFEDAIRRSIRSFLDGKGLEALSAEKEGGLKYTKDYFDTLEENTLGKGKKSSKKAQDEETDNE